MVMAAEQHCIGLHCLGLMELGILAKFLYTLINLKTLDLLTEGFLVSCRW